MRPKQTFWIASFVFALISCRREIPTPPSNPPVGSAKKILLKDITIPHLPSPYYHFEYNADSTVSKVNFDSDLLIYDVLYKGGKISEMRNGLVIKNDTLRYLYDDAGKVFMIEFISRDRGRGVYRHVNFMYDGDQVKEIDWDHAEGKVSYLIDRVLKFTYYSDGNVKTITDRRPAHDVVPESNTTTLFEQYDDKINVDDFDLTHDGIHDQLFLFQGFRLQKNNHRKETFFGSSGDNVVGYTVNYTYTYNSDGAPSYKAGSLLYTAGTQAGQRFQLSTFYTYY